jgi:hypothetical protein
MVSGDSGQMTKCWLGVLIRCLLLQRRRESLVEECWPWRRLPIVRAWWSTLVVAGSRISHVGTEYTILGLARSVVLLCSLGLTYWAMVWCGQRFSRTW